MDVRTLPKRVAILLLAVSSICCSGNKATTGTSSSSPATGGTEKSHQVASPKTEAKVDDPSKDSVGTALMEADGTIRLRLRAQGDKGLVGDAEFKYPPGHADYQRILKHVGGLQVGQEKPVPPWE